MEFPRIEFWSKIQTPSKNVLSSQIQNNNWLKKSPLSWKTDYYEVKNQNNLLWQCRQKKRRRKMWKTFQRNWFWSYVTGHSTAKHHGKIGTCYSLLPGDHYDGAHGTTWEPKDWFMAWIWYNHDYTWKRYGPPAQIKMCLWEVLP